MPRYRVTLLAEIEADDPDGAIDQVVEFQQAPPGEDAQEVLLVDMEKRVELLDEPEEEKIC
jgi:hypothetical protein